MDQPTGKVALFDLFAKFSGVVLFENLVQIGQHRPQRQAHGIAPVLVQRIPRESTGTGHLTAAGGPVEVTRVGRTPA
jgi:hypothetical protein